MTDVDPAEAQDPSPQKRFFRQARSAKLPPESARRQGLVTKLALDTFGDKDAAITYLNSESVLLGGRPLGLATATADGLRSVEQDLAAISAAAPKSRGA